MADLIPLSFALISGWILLAGAGELWFKLATNAKWRQGICTKKNCSTKFCFGGQSVITLSLCRSISALPIVLILSSLEHTQGLGKNLSILLPPLLTICIWLYYSNWKRATKEEKKTRILMETFFGLSIVYVLWLFWGNADLDNFVDKGGDLMNTVAMASGETLPPTHPWLPPYKAEDYYRGQWYAGGILARLCNLAPAHNYFSSYILCIGWITYAVFACSWILTRQKVIASTATLLVITLGGHFGYITAQLTHQENPHPMIGGNLVGRYISTNEHEQSKSLNQLGHRLAENMDSEPKHSKPDSPTNSITCEPYAYSVFLGDWHSSLGGYLMLSILVSAIAGFTISRAPPNLYLSCILIAIVTPACFIFNPWLMPIATISSSITILLGTMTKTNGHKYLLTTTIGGTIIASIIISPLNQLLRAKEYGKLAEFKLIATENVATFTPYAGWLLYAGAVCLWVLLASVSSISNLKPNGRTIYVWSGLGALMFAYVGVQALQLALQAIYPEAQLHKGSPLIPAILIFIPALYLIMLGLAKIQNLPIKQENWMVLTGTTIFATTYALTETVFLDDYLTIPYERYNTSNKWLPTTLFVVTNLCAPIALTAKCRPLKVIAYTLSLLLIVPMAYSIKSHKKTGDAEFGGTSWIKKTDAKTTYENLLKLPKGTVLEYQHKDLDFATPSSLLAMHTGHNAFIGWVYGYLGAWYPSSQTVKKRQEESIMFYEGKLADPSNWAKENGIDYIVWSISLHKKYSEGSTYKPFTAPPNEVIDWAWEINNSKMNKDYTWLETKPAPLKEGIWILKESNPLRD